MPVDTPIRWQMNRNLEEEPMTRNLLARETSPYLLQHADNPVAWFAWGAEALDRAAETGKPILLSVGYAACHWCHVMAHESFENPAIAELMNRLFVNIKVDREERPDLDTIYQAALAALGQPGGWPLTMFLTPAGEPFWGGTYFPPEARWGRAGFPDTLKMVAGVYAREPAKVTNNVDALRQALEERYRSRPGGALPANLSSQAAERLAREFDPVWGGIGEAPKFPNPSLLKFLWQQAAIDGSEDLAKPVLRTLEALCQGGIHDHLGGGFSRYAVDREWLVPHFEKMLYDNGQILELLALLAPHHEGALFGRRAAETVEWALREMRTDGGGFAASFDADSEGQEGKFYVWTLAEIEDVLGSRAAAFAAHYDVGPAGNWEGTTILNRRHQAGLADADTEAALAEARQALKQRRDGRVPPGWDDKILADWNGLMISGLALAALIFDRPDWLGPARDAFGFVRETMQVDGRLVHAWRRGRHTAMGMLNDYAAMIGAALDLHEATGDLDYLNCAVAWADILDRHFRDAAEGGYFDTPDDGEVLLLRTKSMHDNAVPAGAATMIEHLGRLSLLTGDGAYADRARALIAAHAGEAPHNVFPLTTYLRAAQALDDGRQVVVVGERDDAATRALHWAARSARRAPLAVQCLPATDGLDPGHPAFGKDRLDGRATAYFCAGQTCRAPAHTPQDLLETMEAP